MAAILDFANTPALSDSRLGIHLKSKEYNMFYICAKFGSFGRIYPKISLTAPTNSIETDKAIDIYDDLKLEKTLVSMIYTKIFECCKG